jgi:hypothetical protein
LYVLAVVVVCLLIVVGAVVVLVRRDRRRFSAGAGPDSARIEAEATRGLREARRDARVIHDRGPGGMIGGIVGAARDRDPRDH